jgi:hypothetical protein
VPSKTSARIAPDDDVRLRSLQGKLEMLMVEARVLRERLELLVLAQKLAVRELAVARRRTRSASLKRADRVF